MPDNDDVTDGDEAPADESPGGQREKIATETMRRATMLVALQDITQQQSDNIGRLTDSVDRLARVVATKPSRRDILSITGVINLITLFVVASMFFTILHNQGNSRNLLNNGNDTLTLLIDCTTPGPNPPPRTGHDCYDRSLTTQAGAIQVLDCANEAVIRYYISNIPGLTLPAVRPQCVTLVPTVK